MHMLRHAEKYAFAISDHVSPIVAEVIRISVQDVILRPAAIDAYLHLDTPVPHLAVRCRNKMNKTAADIKS
jgi:hypothetical protein